MEHQNPDFYHIFIVNFVVFALKDVDRNCEKVYSIKLTIKTNKLAEKASKNMIYISSCINLPNVLA